MAIYEGETVEITAGFEYQPQGPVRAWIQRPGQATADAPIILTAVDALTYRAEYNVQVSGRHRVRVESSNPVSVEEDVFIAVAKQVRKP